MNKLFWKYFGTYTLWTGAACLTIFTLVVLGNWFTDLAFPYYIFQWDAEDRSGIFWTTTGLVILCALFGWGSSENKLREDENDKYISKLTPEQMEAHYLLMAELSRKLSHTPKKSKGLDAVDIAVGVASGVVIGEVINDLLD